MLIIWAHIFSFIYFCDSYLIPLHSVQVSEAFTPEVEPFLPSQLIVIISKPNHHLTLPKMENVHLHEDPSDTMDWVVVPNYVLLESYTFISNMLKINAHLPWDKWIKKIVNTKVNLPPKILIHDPLLMESFGLASSLLA